MTDTYGILGYPVSHSRSPAMQNAAFRALGIDATYVTFEVRPEHLVDAVRGLEALSVRGANVTVPHKQAVIGCLEQVTREARAIGAVNTLVRSENGFVGHNTDAPGLARSLEEAGVVLSGAHVVVLGAGGAARATVVGLAERGASSIAICARRRDQAETLVRELSSVCGACRLSITALDTETMREVFGGATLLVQSTSATLPSANDAEGFARSLPLEALPRDASVVDLVYKPRDTTVLRAARAHGLQVVDGLGMLLHQGALAFELWTGRRAPLDAMRAALDA